MEFERIYKPKPRKLSRFMCQELLFEFATNRLDKARADAVAEFLKTDKGLQLELESIKESIQYCQKLSHTQVSPEFLKSLVEAQPKWKILAEKLAWKNWPEFLRWTTEAMAISVLVAVLAVNIPWSQLFSWAPERHKEVVLAEVEPLQSAEKAEEVAPIAASTEGETGFQEIGPIHGPPAPTPEQLASAVESAQQVVATEAEAEPKPKENVEAEPAPSPQPVAKGPKGAIYRAFMSVSEVDATSKQILDQLLALGAQKAGEVELGWKRPTGSYFHFSIPEENYQTMVDQLRTLSPVRISREAHWRVMPEGTIRIILWVEDNTLKN